MKYEKLTSEEIQKLDDFLKIEIKLGFTYEINEHAVIFKILDKDILFKFSVLETINSIHNFPIIKFTDDGFIIAFDHDAIPFRNSKPEFTELVVKKNPKSKILNPKSS